MDLELGPPMSASDPDWSVGWVFDRQIGRIRGGTRPTAPVHDGNCGANALRATIVDNRGAGELSGESRFEVVKPNMNGVRQRWQKSLNINT